jgi:chromosome segregation ATPase
MLTYRSWWAMKVRQLANGMDSLREDLSQRELIIVDLEKQVDEYSDSNLNLEEQVKQLESVLRTTEDAFIDAQDSKSCTEVEINNKHRQLVEVINLNHRYTMRIDFR